MKNVSSLLVRAVSLSVFVASGVFAQSATPSPSPSYSNSGEANQIITCPGYSKTRDASNTAVGTSTKSFFISFNFKSARQVVAADAVSAASNSAQFINFTCPVGCIKESRIAQNNITVGSYSCDLSEQSAGQADGVNDSQVRSDLNDYESSSFNSYSCPSDKPYKMHDFWGTQIACNGSYCYSNYTSNGYCCPSNAEFILQADATLDLGCFATAIE